MLTIDGSGNVVNSKVTVKIFPHIECGPMTAINGIIVHQTYSPTSQATFKSYMYSGTNGANFLIDKDGVIYQTASLHKRTNHVGKLRSRCYAEKRCSPAERACQRFCVEEVMR